MIRTRTNSVGSKRPVICEGGFHTHPSGAPENLASGKRQLNEVPLTEVDNIDADKKAAVPPPLSKAAFLKRDR